MTTGPSRWPDTPWDPTSSSSRSSPTRAQWLPLYPATRFSSSSAEGIARDVVRLIQQARKDAGLEVTDRIVCHVASTAEVAEALDSHRDWVAEAVLATELHIAEGVDDDAEARVEGHPVSVQVTRT